MKLVVLLALSICLATIHGQSAQDDLVDNFIGGLESPWYSGYLGLDENTQIHYVFFQSQKDRNDPLIVYLGNGPGCSSLFAMSYENGPFRAVKKGASSFIYNEFGWNQHANLLYLETPGGVGFSRGESQTSDENVTTQTLLAITNFLTRFPTFVKNQLYLSGTGYAGITVPYLALRILQHNENPIFHSKLNLKGILLGNPCTSADECYATGSNKQSYYHYQYLYNHGFLSDNSFNDFKAICAIDYNSAFCLKERLRIDEFFKGLNTSAYHIYDKCYQGSSEGLFLVNGAFEICEDTEAIEELLNVETIQEKLHVDKIKFTVCNEKVHEDYMGNSTGSYWIYPRLLQHQMRIFIFSGDLDSSIPIIGTKKWVARLREDLDIPVKKVWRQWWTEGIHKYEDQVAGMVWQLDTLTLATVRGAGFTVGRDRPKQLYTILNSFLKNQRLPVRK